MGPLILHEDPRSGNCYKIRLTAAHLRIPLERRFYDIIKGETRTPDFLARVNPNGRIPVLQDGDRLLPESNAACFYLADGSDLVPIDRFARADMLRWMFWEQYNHEPNVATVRAWLTIVGLDSLTEAQRLNLPRPTVSRLAYTLLCMGYLAQDEGYGKYRLGSLSTQGLVGAVGPGRVGSTDQQERGTDSHRRRTGLDLAEAFRHPGCSAPGSRPKRG